MTEVVLKVTEVIVEMNERGKEKKRPVPST